MYEGITGTLIEATGFLSHDTLQAGCSLDGHVGDDYRGIIEIKCPIPATHLDSLRSGKVPTDYYKQVTHNLWMSGAEWCDWLSYNPDFPDSLQVKLVRVYRNESEIHAYEDAVTVFLAEVAAEVEAVSEMARKAAA